MSLNNKPTLRSNLKNKEFENKIHTLLLELENANRELSLFRNKREYGYDNIIERQKNSKLKLEKLKRLHSFISQINKKILRANNQETLFGNACQIALQFGKFKAAWIGLFDNDLKKMTIVKHSGIGEEDFMQFNNIPIKIGGPEQYVLKHKRSYVCNDIEDILELGNWKKIATKHGILSAIVLPLKKSGKIIGTFNLYSTELKFAANEEIQLIINLAKDISFAIDLIEKERLHKESEELLTLNEHRFRAIIESSRDLITLSEEKGEIFYVGSNVVKLFGYTCEEIQQKFYTDFIHPDDLSDFVNKRKKILKKNSIPSSFEIRLKHKHKNWIWHECTLSNFLNRPDLNAIIANFRNIAEMKALSLLKAFNKKNLKALINNTSDLIWSVDKNFNLIHSNQAFDENQKAKTGKMILYGSNAISTEISTQELIRYKKYYERAFAGEIFTEIEYTAFPKEKWQEVSFNPIWEGDEVIATTCHSRDVTDRKHGGEKLKKSERFNKAILDSLSAHIAVVDFNGNIISVNDSWKRFGIENGGSRLTGTDEGNNYFEVCEKSIKDGVADAFEALQGMKDVINNKRKSFYMEYPCNSPMQIRWFCLTVRKFDNDEPMIVVSHQDISERKLAEQKQLKSEASLKEAQAISHTGNWELDFDTKVHTWSDELYTIFGIKEKTASPSTEYFLSFMHPDDIDEIKAKVDEAFKNKQATSYAFRFIRLDGEVRYGYTERKFEFDNNNKPKRLLGVVQDVTERRLAEQEREKMVSNIIQQSNNQEQFAYIISHNLRAPIATIMGLANLLKETDSKEDAYKIQQHVVTSVIKLDDVISDLNKILQVKSEITEHRELIYFENIVKDIKFSISNLIEKEHVSITTNFDAINKLHTFKGYLHSIFYNLISNSIKYRQREINPIVTITTEKLNDRIRIIFQDNGMGMDLELYGDKIFGLYKRFHPYIEGKGFGLFMVKTHVEVLGGTITLFSEPNKGARFIIEFPLDDKMM